MDEITRSQLTELNRRFYVEHARDFAATRRRAWAGWREISKRIRSIRNSTADSTRPLSILDIGCGNARFFTFLRDEGIGIDRYVGIDASKEMLDSATSAIHSDPAATLLHADVLERPLATLLSELRFDLVVLFGVLHHVPGMTARRDLLRSCIPFVRVGEDPGSIVVTLWRFLTHDAALASRIVPLEDVAARTGIALDRSALEPGDTLLPFGDDPSAIRYAHHFSDADAESLVAGLPLTLRDSFTADGDGEANRYLVLACAQR